MPTRQVQAVAGIEARGFILGGAIADRLGCGFVPLRKKGKLPWKTIGQEYTLEYGVDIIEMHEDAIDKGERILIVDDLIATGGTAEAAVKLVQRSGGVIVGATFIIDLPELGGMKKLASHGVREPRADGLRGALRLRMALTRTSSARSLRRIAAWRTDPGCRVACPACGKLGIVIVDRSARPHAEWYVLSCARLAGLSETLNIPLGPPCHRWIESVDTVQKPLRRFSPSCRRRASAVTGEGAPKGRMRGPS